MAYPTELREELANKHKEFLRTDEERYEKTGDIGIIYSHSFLGVAEYMKTGDIKAFREHLRLAAWYRLELFRRAYKGEKISPTFLEPHMFKEMLTALAAGDYELFKGFCPFIRDINVSCHPLVRRFFRVLKDLTCGDDGDLEEAIKDMKEYFEKKNKSYVGYADAFEAIRLKNEEAFKEAFQKIMKGHKVLTRPGAQFSSTPSEDIAIWPLGMANLARFKGLKADVGSYEMLPEELIVKV